MSDNLLPCPFCGSPALSLFEDGDMEGYTVLCSGKGAALDFQAGAERCPLTTVAYARAEDAIAAWNRRTGLADRVPEGWQLVAVEAGAGEDGELWEAELMGAGAGLRIATQRGTGATIEEAVDAAVRGITE